MRNNYVQLKKLNCETYYMHACARYLGRKFRWQVRVIFTAVKR